MQDLLSADQRIHHVAQARALLEEIFASLHLRAFALDQQRDVQRERTVNHALAFKFADNLGEVGAWNDIEDLVRSQRTRLAHALLAPNQADHGDDGGDQQKREKPADGGKDRPTPAWRHWRRRRRSFRLERFVRTLRRNPGATEPAAACDSGGCLDFIPAPAALDSAGCGDKLTGKKDK